MRKKLLWLALVAGLLWSLLWPQWRSYDRMGERRFQVLSQPRKEVLVGVYWPFSVNQDGMADGLQLARDEINAGGLAGGIPVRLILREGFNWEQAKRIAIEFSNTPGMSAVLGYYDDSEAVKASMMYESSQLLHIMVGANNTPMTARGLRYIVRTVLSGDKIARSLAKWSVESGRRKFALIWEEGAFGEDLAYQYRVGLDALDAQLVYQWPYSREHADFRLPVNELKGIDADMIFIAGFEPWAGDFLRMAREVGIKTVIMGAFSDTPAMRARAGRALEGSIYFDFYDVNSPSPENREFVRKFRSRYGRDPDTWAAQGYDALRLLAKAVRATGSLNPLDLSYAIRFMDPWEGANGRYKFDSRGELDGKPLYLKQFQKGKPVTIQETGSVPEPLFQRAPG
jgi:branched-chain amino acid transport system substrate-binding protein